jgi:hypothetical protein
MPGQSEKRQKLEERITEYIHASLSMLEIQGGLGYFDISISVHNEILSCNLLLKEKKKI